MSVYERLNQTLSTTQNTTSTRRSKNNNSKNLWALALETTNLAETEIDTTDTLEWEDTPSNEDTVDKDIVDDIKAKVDADELTTEIEEADDIVYDTRTQVAKLEKLKDVVHEEWDEHGDITDEVLSIDPSIESRWRRDFKSERTPTALASAIEMTMTEMGIVGIIGVGSVAIAKIVQRIKLRLKDSDKIGAKLDAALTSAQNNRLKMKLSPDDVIDIASLKPLLKNHVHLTSYVDTEGPGATPTLREVSNAYVEAVTTNWKSPVLAASVNNPLIVEEAAKAIGEAQDCFVESDQALSVLIEGLNKIVKGQFTGDWETFSTVPFVKDLAEKTRQAESKMSQMPMSTPTQGSIEKCEVSAKVVSRCLTEHLKVQQDLFIKTLNNLEKRMNAFPDKLDRLDEDVRVRGEHLTSSIREYIDCVRLLSEYTEMYCHAGKQLTLIIDGHDDLMKALDKTA